MILIPQRRLKLVSSNGRLLSLVTTWLVILVKNEM